MGNTVISTKDVTVEVKGKSVFINGRLVCEDLMQQAKFTKVSNLVFLIAGFVAGGFSAAVIIQILPH